MALCTNHLLLIPIENLKVIPSGTQYNPLPLPSPTKPKLTFSSLYAGAQFVPEVSKQVFRLELTKY